MDTPTHDVVIVGAGPAGMQTAILLASEGRKVLVLEGHKIGGQIGQTPKLENFLGQTVHGTSGPAFAHKMEREARDLGAEIAFARVSGIERTPTGVKLTTDTGDLLTRSVVIATGATWRNMDIPGIQCALTHRVARYGPSCALAAKKSSKTVLVVGGGNSAAQGIIAMAAKAKHVHVVIRSKAKYSEYLRSRIEHCPNVTIHDHTTIAGIERCGARGCDVVFNGGDRLFVNLILLCNDSVPNTQAFRGTLTQDEKGYLVTGGTLETSMPGVFAIGDCRATLARKCVARAVGDAAQVTDEVHHYLTPNER